MNIHIGKYRDVTKFIDKNCKIHIITDNNIKNLYLGRISKLLNATFTSLEAREDSKNIENALQIIQTLSNLSFSREDIIIGLGGGMVLDIAGFVASIYKRGTRLIKIPTSILAMVDASIGGKNAVNALSCKNLIGSFYESELVIINKLYINYQQINSSIAEIIKCGYIHNPKILDIVKEDFNDSLIDLAIATKKHYVKKDFYDKGIRHHLNFGHTIGHLVEISTNFQFSHNSSVAIGMNFAIFVSMLKFNLDSQIYVDFLKLMTKYKLPYFYDLTENFIKAQILNDKKAFNGKVSFVLIEKIGQAIICDLSIKEILKYFSLWRNNEFFLG